MGLCAEDKHLNVVHVYDEIFTWPARLCHEYPRYC